MSSKHRRPHSPDSPHMVSRRRSPHTPPKTTKSSKDYDDYYVKKRDKYDDKYAKYEDKKEKHKYDDYKYKDDDFDLKYSKKDKYESASKYSPKDKYEEAEKYDRYDKFAEKERYDDTEKYNKYSGKDKYDKYEKYDKGKYENKEKFDMKERYDKYEEKGKYEDKGRYDKYEEKGKYDKYEEKGKYDKYEEKGKYDKYEDKGKYDKYEEKVKYDKYEDKGKYDKYDDKGKYAKYEEKVKFDKYDNKGKYGKYDDKERYDKFEEKGKHEKYVDVGKYDKYTSGKFDKYDKTEGNIKYDRYDKDDEKVKYDRYKYDKPEDKDKYERYDKYEKVEEKEKYNKYDGFTENGKSDKYDMKGKYDKYTERDKSVKYDGLSNKDKHDSYEEKGKYDKFEEKKKYDYDKYEKKYDDKYTDRVKYSNKDNDSKYFEKDKYAKYPDKYDGYQEETKFNRFSPKKFDKFSEKERYERLDDKYDKKIDIYDKPNHDYVSKYDKPVDKYTKPKENKRYEDKYDTKFNEKYEDRSDKNNPKHRRLSPMSKLDHYEDIPRKAPAPIFKDKYNIKYGNTSDLPFKGNNKLNEKHNINHSPRKKPMYSPNRSSSLQKNFYEDFSPTREDDFKRKRVTSGELHAKPSFDSKKQYKQPINDNYFDKKHRIEPNASNSRGPHIGESIRRTPERYISDAKKQRSTLKSTSSSGHLDRYEFGDYVVYGSPGRDPRDMYELSAQRPKSPPRYQAASRYPQENQLNDNGFGHLAERRPRTPPMPYSDGPGRSTFIRQKRGVGRRARGAVGGGFNRDSRQTELYNQDRQRRDQRDYQPGREDGRRRQMNEGFNSSIIQNSRIQPSGLDRPARRSAIDLRNYIESKKGGMRRSPTRSRLTNRRGQGDRGRLRGRGARRLLPGTRLAIVKKYRTMPTRRRDPLPRSPGSQDGEERLYRRRASSIDEYSDSEEETSRLKKRKKLEKNHEEPEYYETDGGELNDSAEKLDKLDVLSDDINEQEGKEKSTEEKK